MFEYVTVKLHYSQGVGEREDQWSRILNDQARQGWRLVNISSEAFRGGQTANYATFERETRL